MRKSIIIICVLWFLFTPLIYAYQFENYVWGTPKDKVLAQLKEKGKDLKFLWNLKGEKVYLFYENELEYSDTILDRHCNITLDCTSKTQLLYTIKIQWEDDYKLVGKDLKSVLTKKYGEPIQHQQPEQDNRFIERFFWRDIEDDWIELSYVPVPIKKDLEDILAGVHPTRNVTFLTYTSGQYEKMTKKEKEEEKEKMLLKEGTKF